MRICCAHIKDGPVVFSARDTLPGLRRSAPSVSVAHNVRKYGITGINTCMNMRCVCVRVCVCTCTKHKANNIEIWGKRLRAASTEVQITIVVKI